MITVLLASALAVTLAQQPTDTTFDVRPGGTLQVDALHGSVTITTWDRAAMRIRETQANRRSLEIDRSGSSVTIDVEGRYGPPPRVQLEITVPRDFNIEVEGVTLPITVDGVQGSVRLENVEGGLTVRRTTGPIELESVSGTIIVEDVRGYVDASSVNDAVRLTNVRGDIQVETTNGAIVMRGIDAERVEANTVNGIVEYYGTVHDGGDYYLGTHNGRVTIAIPESANARLAIEANNGKVEAAFPVPVRRIDDGEFSIVIGNGSARIELESFNGSIYLVRPTGR